MQRKGLLRVEGIGGQANPVAQRRNRWCLAKKASAGGICICKPTAIGFGGAELLTGTRGSDLLDTQSPYWWFVHQHYECYTAGDHQTWRLLFERRRSELIHIASGAFERGLSWLGIEGACIPDLTVLNIQLTDLCGWSVMPVKGFLPSRTFFSCLEKRIFPCTTYVRDATQLGYTSEPDIFHDVFGHLPLYCQSQYRDYVQRLGRLAKLARTDEQLSLLAQTYWFTVEFGLIREGTETRVYGSGLLSSTADCQMALGPHCQRRRFQLDDVLAQPVSTDTLQKVLFVIDSYDELESTIAELEGRLLSS